MGDSRICDPTILFSKFELPDKILLNNFDKFSTHWTQGTKLKGGLYCLLRRGQENVEWYIEDKAFLWSYDSAPRTPPSPFSRQQVVYLSQSSCVSPVELTDERVGGGGGGWARRQIIRPRESLALYKSFNTLWAWWKHIQMIFGLKSIESCRWFKRHLRTLLPDIYSMLTMFCLDYLVRVQAVLHKAQPCTPFVGKTIGLHFLNNWAHLFK